MWWCKREKAPYLHLTVFSGMVNVGIIFDYILELGSKFSLGIE